MVLAQLCENYLIQIKAYEIKSNSIDKLPDLEFSFRQGLCLNYNFEEGLLCAPHGDAETFDGRFCWLLNSRLNPSITTFAKLQARISTIDSFCKECLFVGHF